MLALTVRKPETFRRFLDAAGEPLCPILSDVLAYTGTGEAFVVTSLGATTTAEVERGRRDEHSGQEIVIMQLDIKG